MPRKKRQIVPIKSVPEGIIECYKIAQYSLDDAELLIDKQRVKNAAVLVVQSIEEVGKAKILDDKLKDAYEKQNPSIEIIGRNDPIYDHFTKISVGLQALPNEIQTLTLGTFSPSGDFYKTGKTLISQAFKENLTYTDYEDGKWIYPYIPDPAQLKSLIGTLRGTIGTMSSKFS